MKISYNWLKRYISHDMSVTDLGDLLTALGLEVEGIDTYESVKGSLEGICVGKILTKEQHPNADRLSLCSVDVGGENALQIVCGAPNVAADQKVLVATNGTTLYSAEGDSFVIKRSKIRGIESNGMICAEDELGLGQSHDGIMVLEDSAEVGTAAIDLFPVYQDHIYDIGLTPNRSDGTSHIGTARDVAAAINFHQKTNVQVNYPAQKLEANTEANIEFSLEIKDAAACPRYSGVIIENIKIGESPDWLKNNLNAIGLRPINNVVDITNFVLHEYGQPLHAFDLHKIKGNGICVTKLPNKTKFVTLDEKEISLNADDLMICDKEMNPMCMGGVFGGVNSGVTDTTTAIFLEAAHFEAKGIRRSSMRHQLRTDAAKTFEKGTDPSVTLTALKRAASLMAELAEGKIQSAFYDVYENKIPAAEISLRYARVNEMMGVDMDVDDIKRIMTCLSMPIIAEDEKSITVRVPQDKADVLREIDLIEEIIRVYGFDNVPVSNKLKTSIVFNEGLSSTDLKNKLIDKLTALGCFQIMNLSLSQSAYYDESAHPGLLFINNTSNSHLDIMRPDMVHSALETISHNIKRQQKDLTLFELGKVYEKKAVGDYLETEKLAIALTGEQVSDHWQSATKELDIYYLKSLVEKIIPVAASKHLKTEAIEADGLFDYGLALVHNGKRIGTMAKVATTIESKFDVEQAVFFAEIDWTSLLSLWSKQKIVFTDINKFPEMRRDLALIVDKGITYEKVDQVIQKFGGKKLKTNFLFDLYTNEKHVGEGKKSFGVGLTYADENATLNDKQVDKMTQKLLSALERECGAVLR